MLGIAIGSALRGVGRMNPGQCATPALRVGELQTAEFKTKNAIKKLCEHCYIKRKKNKKWYVYCKANPGHKQRQI